MGGALVATLPAIGLAVLVAALVLVAFPEHFGATVATVMVYIGTAGGPGVAIPAGLAMKLPLVLVVSVLWLVDLALSLFFANAVRIEAWTRRFPRLGAKLERVQLKLSGRKRARASLIAAIAAFVAAPIHSGGAVIGTLLGRACGLSAAAAVGTVATAAALRMAAWAFVWGGAWSWLGL